MHDCVPRCDVMFSSLLLLIQSLPSSTPASLATATSFLSEFNTQSVMEQLLAEKDRAYAQLEARYNKLKAEQVSRASRWEPTHVYHAITGDGDAASDMCGCHSRA